MIDSALLADGYAARTAITSLVSGMVGNSAVTAPFVQFACDPVHFVLNVMKPKELMPGQADILEAVAEHDRVGLRKANGIGGTTVAAWLTHWFLGSRVNAVIPTTAGKEMQVKILWLEIHEWAASMKPYVELDITKMSMKKNRLDVWPKWYARGFTSGLAAGQEDTGRAEGWHGDHVLFIVDEGRAIADARWNAALGSLTGENAKVFALSVTGPAMGWFSKIFTEWRQTWKGFSIPAAIKIKRDGNIDEDQIGRLVPTQRAWVEKTYTEEKRKEFAGRWVTATSNVSQKSIDEKLEYGEKSAVFMSRARAEFIPQVEGAAIQLEWIEDSIGREIPVSEGTHYELGVDPAAGGRSNTGIVKRHGANVVGIMEIDVEDTMRIVGLIKRQRDGDPDMLIKVDKPGLGIPIHNRLDELMIRHISINTGDSPRDAERYKKLRDEILGNIRDRFREGRISLPKPASSQEQKVLDRLIMQLVSLTSTITSDGREKFIDKKELTNTLDLVDALALAFAPVGERGPVKITIEQRGVPFTANLMGKIF